MIFHFVLISYIVEFCIDTIVWCSFFSIAINLIKLSICTECTETEQQPKKKLDIFRFMFAIRYIKIWKNLRLRIHALIGSGPWSMSVCVRWILICVLAFDMLLIKSIGQSESFCWIFFLCFFFIWNFLKRGKRRLSFFLKYSNGA